MHSPHHTLAREADRVANRICKRRLMNASLAAAAAWLTYVNPVTFQVRTEGGWAWLTAVVVASLAAGGFALWSITAGDRRAWMRAFHAATRDHSAPRPTSPDRRRRPGLPVRPGSAACLQTSLLE